MSAYHRSSKTAGRNLSLGRPDALEESIALGESVHRVVALAHGANEAGESIDNVLTSNGAAVLVNLGDGDLARAVILGLDDTVGGRALAGDVTGGRNRRLAQNKRPISKLAAFNPARGRRLQVDDFTTVVLHFCGL